MPRSNPTEEARVASGVEVKPWPEFLQWWAQNWHPGEHVAILAPTGAGKTTLEIGLAQVRKYIVALDAKGGDDSLSASGWRRVQRWPLPHDVMEAMRNGEPAHIIVGKITTNKLQRQANRELLVKALQGLYDMGRWTVLVDELQLLSDARFLGAGKDVEELLIAARNKKLSVVSTFQRPSIGQTARAAGPATDQATWVAVAYTRDSKVVNRLAEMLGRPAAECRGLIQALDPFTWAIVGRDPRASFVITKPPEVKLPVGKDADKAKARSLFSYAMWGEAA